MGRASRSVTALLHRLAANLLENSSLRVEDPWRIAAHWQNAGDHERARKSIRHTWRTSISLGEPAKAEESIGALLETTHDNEQRVYLLEELIEASKLSGNYAGVLRCIDEREKAVLKTGLEDSKRDQVAFDRLDAVLPRLYDPSHFAEELSRLAQSSKLDQERRCRASVLLMIAAESQVDPTLASACISEIDSLSQTIEGARTYHTLAHLIYHTVFGDLAQAGRLARTSLEIAPASFSEWSLFRLRTSASLALTVTGDIDLAINECVATYGDAQKRGIGRVSILTGSILASLCFDKGALDESREWLRRVSNIANRQKESVRPVEALSADADLAMLDSRFDDAKTCLNTMRESLPLYEAPRYQNELTAYRIRLASFTGDDIERDDVEHLMRWHLKARQFARHDDCMEALWTGLCAIGRQGEATGLLSEYLSQYRRERGPVRHMLRIRTSSDPSWTSYLSTEQQREIRRASWRPSA
jgi:hypothetical protein